MKGWLPRLRLLPLALISMAFLAVVKLERLLQPVRPAPVVAPVVAAVPARAVVAPAPAPEPAPVLNLGAAMASSPAPAPAPAPPPPPPAPPLEPDPRAEAERALLGSLRARRTELDHRAEELAQRELLLQASERRLNERLEEMRALQTRLEGELRARNEREEAGIRQLVRVYESMRPRDAATILDDLEMPVLLQVIDRMREAKAAPVLAAMRPDRARAVTTELSRLRSRAPD